MDPRMAAEVTKRVQGKPEHKRLEVILGDVIKQDMTDFNFDCRLSVNAQFWAKISHVLFDGLLRLCFNRRNKVLRALFLGNKEALKLMETNYRLFCATQGIPIDEGLVDDAGEDEEMDDDDNDNDNDASMDVDGEDELPSFFGAAKNPDESIPTSKRGSARKSRLAVLVKEKVRKVLEETELAESRSAKLHENDFLRLLAAFNAEGIHFS
ncbi:hypothetical protein GQX73_g8035 [Xylaria multiplex]|uniref:Uncharacterized protein n=1 Tax=Xylaria multiplex TaxID=323545 RepID=A0A7C8N379_9PEZI|nr:hypothetical protein GQX73_g8035 [Xylaria multiplex]